jgi:hypothetical protein
MNKPSRGGVRVPLVPVILLLLALLDLQTEIRLLIDHFTVTSLVSAIQTHLLATTTLLLLPSLWRHYQRQTHLRPQGGRVHASEEFIRHPSDP